MSTARSLLGLLAWIAACFSAGALGSLFTTNSVADWYPQLTKPAWTPPSAVFGPVWSVLYLLMALAAWLVWRSRGFSGATLPLTLFAVQLLLNFAWSVIFFGLRLPGPAFAEIVLLWALILATLITFWRVIPLAGGLLLPYLAWVSFAAALNLAIWRLNA